MTDNETTKEWEKIEHWVKLYSWITFGAVIYGILAAHVPFIIGHPWTTCEVCGSKLGCVLVFHLYEVPLVSFNAFIVWYGLKRFSRKTIHNYMSLLTFSVVVNIAFFTFECGLLLDGIRREQALWETLALTSVAMILIGGAGLAIYVKQLMVSFVFKPKD